MIPRTIVARPDDLGIRSEPDIIPLPGSRRPERDVPTPHRPHGPANAGSELGPRDILNALRFHSVLFVTLGGLAAASLFSAAWLLVPAKYTTYATLLVDQRTPTNMPAPAGGANEDGLFAIYLKTQASFIKSHKTIGGALLDPKYGIAQLPMLRNEEDPADYLEQKILIDLTDTSNSALRVTLSGDDPKQITAVVNAVVDFYLQEVKTWGEERARRIAKLTKSRDDLQQRLNDKLKHFQDVFISSDPSDAKSFQQQIRMTRYVELLHRQGQARADLTAWQSALKNAQAKLEDFDAKPPPIPMPIEDLIEKDAAVWAKGMALRKLLRDMKAIESQSANPYTPTYFEMKRQAAVEAAELESLKQKVRDKIEKEYRAIDRAKLVEVVTRAQDQVKLIEPQEQSFTEQLAEFKDLKDLEHADNKQMAERTAENDAIQRYRTQIAQIDSSVTHLTADLDAPDRVRLWQKAEEPTKKDIRKQAALSGAAGLMGLGLVGGLISVYEMRRKRVFGASDPLFRQKLPLLGCLPECASPASAKADAIDPAGRAFFEAMDKVKAVVCRQLLRRKMQAILVTSAVPGEGKSALAWHLALSLARSDRRTLFIDGNLRNPGLHNHFDIASHPGLSELIRGERSVQEVIQRTALDNLWCIAAGVCDESGRQALDKEALRTVLDRARRDFDYIVIDACSIREAVDPLYLAQRADATLLAVRSFHSGTADVERACDRLTQIGTPLLGAVLTDPSGAGCEL